MQREARYGKVPQGRKAEAGPRLALLCICICLLACDLKPPHVVLTVQDPDGAAVDLATLMVGADRNAMKEATLSRSEFPLTVTVSDAKTGTRLLWVEAKSSTGEAIARGKTSVTLKKSSTSTATVTLRRTCNTIVDCDDGLFCTGTATCNDEGMCQPGESRCAPDFPCVISTCHEDPNNPGNGFCSISVDHSRCAEESYCEPSSGCIPGRACDVSADCDDGFVCNGTERCLNQRGDECKTGEDCVGLRCDGGPLPDLDDGDTCTFDGCNDELLAGGESAIFHSPSADLEGTPCTIPNTGDLGICVATMGGCVESTCGDGHRDLLTEPCDDGSESNEDECVRLVQPDGSFVCALATCGDGYTWTSFEACDDGNQESGDGCRADCRKIEICGDGLIDAGEPCDDGNDNPNDGCDACSTTTWTATVVAGEGEAAGDPLKTWFLKAASVATDRAGNIYVADPVKVRVWRIDATAGRISLVAGSGHLGWANSGPATAAPLGTPAAIAVDGLGNLYIAERDAFRITKVNTRGIIEPVAGVAGLRPAPDEVAPENIPATLARIDSPTGVTVDGNGNVYLSEEDQNRIRRVDASTGLISTVIDTEILRPTRMVFDSASNLFICDYGNNVVRRVDAQTGAVTIVAGGGSSFLDNVPATETELRDPIGLALHEDRLLYIATVRHSRVRRVDLQTGIITTVAGNGDSGTPILDLQATLSPMQPADIALEPDGDLIIIDGHAGLVMRVGADGVLQLVAGRPDLVDQSVTNAYVRLLLLSPGGIAPVPPDYDEFVFCEQSTHSVQFVGSEGTTLHVAGTGKPGFYPAEEGGPAQFAHLNAPRDVAVDSTGNIYVADRDSNRIRLLEYVCNYDPAVCEDSDDLDSSTTDRLKQQFRFHTFAGCTASDESCSCEPSVDATCHRLSAPLNGPAGVALDPDSGTVYIADSGNHRILRVVGDTLNVAAGTGTAGFADGEAATAQLSTPLSLVFQPELSVMGGILTFSDILFIADHDNHRVRLFAEDSSVPGIPPGPTVQTVTGTGSAGYGETHVEYPRGVAPFYDQNTGEARLLVVEGFDRVRNITAATTLPLPMGTMWGGEIPSSDGPLKTSLFGAPLAAARLGPTDGTWLVVDSTAGTVRQLTRGAGGTVTTVAGYPEGHETEDGEAAFARLLNVPSGVAVDVANAVAYVSEAGAGRIMRISTTSDPWRIRTFVADGVLHTGTGGATTVPVALLRSPRGLYFDPCDGGSNACGPCTKSLYVADAGEHVVRAINFTNPTPEMILVAGSPGQMGFHGEELAATEALLNAPEAVAVGLDGSLYIADTANHRVRRIDCDGVIRTVLGEGQPSSSGVGAPARFLPVDEPRGLAVDAHGNLFVSSRDAIRLVAASPIATGDSTVSTVYGAAPRDDYPEAVTRCLTGVTVAAEDSIFLLDACTGFAIELVRSMKQQYVPPDAP